MKFIRLSEKQLVAVDTIAGLFIEPGNDPSFWLMRVIYKDGRSEQVGTPYFEREDAIAKLADFELMLIEKAAA